MSNSFANYGQYRWAPTNQRPSFPEVDNFYYKREIIDSTGPFRYVTDQNKWLPLTNCSQYIPGAGGPHLENQGFQLNQVDLDSDLRRQFRPLTLCPSHKYQPQAARRSKSNHFLFGKAVSLVNCDHCENCNLGLPCSCPHCKANLGAGHGNNSNNLPLCQNQIIPEPARPFGKACNIPGAFVNRFEALCDDLQALDKIDNNQKIGMDSRNVTKDSFSYKNYRAAARKAGLPKRGCFPKNKALVPMPSNV